MHSLFLSQRRACASSKPLVTSCATPLACHLLLCCKSWIIHFVTALFCHKPWVVKGIASYLACAWHSSKVRVLLSPWFQCNSSTDFINTKLALWLLSPAVKPHKDRYTHCLQLPSASWSLHQRCCCALYHCGNRLASESDKTYDRSCRHLTPR